ncbi:DUF551 domain-containing protein [Cupriavidus sp. D384]|uniref:DUF551 domain-containing protein n=1 Tax=Cupriavidus sp. D384 TaxID=1538095 RepID=UPI00082B2F62|nr:DUF551 domain-containing protein [Cupriavidus sp. D384]
MTTWIKSNTELPSIRQTVLISIQGRVMPAWFDGAAFREIGGGMYPNHYMWPSHWMPLPQSPKEEA